MFNDAQIQLLGKFDVPALFIADGRVEFANPAASILLGQHIVGQDVRVALRDPTAVRLLASEDEGKVQIQGLSVPGSRWELSLYPLGDVKKLAILNDLSAQSSVARAHADFVANASHELRTPLAAILGYVEALAQAKASQDETTRTRFLGIIKQEAQRMQVLVDDLMSLSRIEANKHDAPQDEVDLIGIARQIVNESGNEFVVLSTNAERSIVRGDAGQLAQLMRNLMENAIKYGKPGGRVSIIIDLAATGWVSVSVKDEGEGIAPEHLPRLTERFYRVDEGRSRAAGGTGLGLSIVKHIVERHRGRFDLSSRQGEGTTASFILPPASMAVSQK